LPEDVRRRFISRFRSRINSDGELVLHSQRFRSHSRNQTDCLEKLRELLASVAQRPTPRKPTKPSTAKRNSGGAGPRLMIRLPSEYPLTYQCRVPLAACQPLFLATKASADKRHMAPCLRPN
jgi:hypothetical protein